MDFRGEQKLSTEKLIKKQINKSAKNQLKLTKKSTGKWRDYMESKKRRFKSTDGINTINSVIWYPDENKYSRPVAIVQIVHGMMEHIGRYEGFAEYLNKKGIMVVGHDHLGHGSSVKSKDDFGYFTKEKQSEHLVDDTYRLTCIMKKKYPDVPYAVIGHSMGSFIVRRYISTYPDAVDCAVVMGTGNQADIMLYFGEFMSGMIRLIHGDRYRSSILDKIVFGPYNRKIKNPIAKNDWITTDADELKKYNNDEKCQFIFTANGFKGLFDTILFVKKKRNIKKIPKDFPVLLISGAQDPVGGYGRDVERLYNTYTKYLNDVELKLYSACRHELFSSEMRQEAFKDVYEWLMSKLK